MNLRLSHLQFTSYFHLQQSPHSHLPPLLKGGPSHILPQPLFESHAITVWSHIKMWYLLDVMHAVPYFNNISTWNIFVKKTSQSQVSAGTNTYFRVENSITETKSEVSFDGWKNKNTNKNKQKKITTQWIRRIFSRGNVSVP